MKLSLKLLVLGAAVSAAIVPVQAFAQTQDRTTHQTSPAPYAERHIGDDEEVIFHDEDTLMGDTPDWYGGGLRVTPRVLRAGLIRPRTNFVPELLKSVENL